MSKSLGLMILLAHLKFCWRILNFAGAVFEAKVASAKDPRQQNFLGARQKIPSLARVLTLSARSPLEHHTLRHCL
jgi:hypothetical protein